VKAGQFREDLYFRLNVITLTLPPLRERRGDIAALAQFFLDRHTKDAKRPGMTLSPAALDSLTRYPWPGNIRELDNVIARAVVLSPTDIIEPSMLSLLPEDASLGASDRGQLPYLDLPYHESMDEHGRYIIDRAIERADGNQTKAAEFLKLQRTYLLRLIKQRKSRQE
jgi:DNA-binding NtrC family response regulator